MDVLKNLILRLTGNFIRRALLAIRFLIIINIEKFWVLLAGAAKVFLFFIKWVQKVVILCNLLCKMFVIPFRCPYLDREGGILEKTPQKRNKNTRLDREKP